MKKINLNNIVFLTDFKGYQMATTKADLLREALPLLEKIHKQWVKESPDQIAIAARTGTVVFLCYLEQLLKTK